MLETSKNSVNQQCVVKETLNEFLETVIIKHNIYNKTTTYSIKNSVYSEPITTDSPEDYNPYGCKNYN